MADCQHPIHRLRRFNPGPKEDWLVCQDCKEGFSWDWVICPNMEGLGKRLMAILKAVNREPGAPREPLASILPPTISLADLRLRSERYQRDHREAA